MKIAILGFAVLIFSTHMATAQSVDPFWDLLDSKQKSLSEADKIRNKIGNCEYQASTAIREVRSSDCGPAGKKKICHVIATCSKADSVQGSCFVDSLCPNDPIDCLAKRDIVIIKAGSDAVETAGGAIVVPNGKRVVR